MTDPTDILKRAKELHVRLESLRYKSSEIKESISKIEVQAQEKFGVSTAEDLQVLKDKLQDKLTLKLAELNKVLEVGRDG